MSYLKIIIHDLAAHPFVFQLSEELSKQNIKVYHIFSTFFQSPNQGNLNKENDIANLELVPIEIGEVYSKTNFVKRRNLDIIYGKAVSEKIKEIEPDIFVNCVSQLDSSRLIQKTCLDIGVKYLTWLQDIYSIAIGVVLKKKIPVLGKIISSYYQSAEAILLRKSEHVISITEDFIPLLVGWNISKERISVIPNWANINEIAYASKNNAWAVKNGLQDKFCFLYSGTLGFKHNPEILSVLANRFKSNQDVKIVVISEGQGAEWLKKEKLKKNIDNLVIMNYQSFREFPDVLATGDVLISILEKDAGIYSVPSKVLSYLCAKRPLLLSVPAENLAAKIVKNNEMGMVSSPGDVDLFLNSAVELYTNKEKRIFFGNNSRAYAEKNFEIKSITHSFIKIFESGMT